MSITQIRVVEDKIRDLERIVRANEAVYEMEKSPQRRTELAKEIGSVQYEIDRLREKIENLKSID
jgi:hypothetical protein